MKNNSDTGIAATTKSPAFLSRQVVEGRYGFLDLKPSPGVALVVVCGGCEHCRPDYVIDRRDFPYASLEFVLRGHGTLRLNKHSQPLAAGSVFTYGPGIPHMIRADPDDPFVKYFVDFTGRRAVALLREAGLAPGTASRVAAPRQLMDDFETLIANLRDNAPGTTRRCTAFLEYLLLRVAGNFRPEGADVSPSFSTYLRCRLLLHERFLTLRALDDLANACHLDKAYLCRLYHRFEGRTPHQSLIRLKMNQAAEWLLTGDRSIKDVAAAVGFPDAYHFSRVFHRVYGISPSAFVHGAHRGA